MSACASQISIRVQVQLNIKYLQEKKKDSICLHQRSSEVVKRENASFIWIFSAGNIVGFIIIAFLQDTVKMGTLQRKQECCASLRTLQEERVKGRGVHKERQPEVRSVTSLIKWRHSEKCFPLVAAIYFLVLICALWQGFVKGNNEQLEHSPPQLLSPLSEGCEDDAGLYYPDKEKRIQNGFGENLWE